MNAETFFAVYREELKRAIVEHPDEYRYSVDDADVVADRMIEALKRNSYNKDGRAFKATCKRLGIKYTYAAINAIVNPR